MITHLDALKIPYNRGREAIPVKVDLPTDAATIVAAITRTFMILTGT